jgi:beta-1,4-N-acetylglucosaminyltransferase
MILVTVGTNEARFDRLLLAVDGIAGEEELIVQHGGSPVRPSGALCFESLPYEELGALIRRARVVVAHAGVGSVLTALANGKRPVVVPRLKRFGEAVDDHQLAFGRRLAEAGLVTFVEDPGGLRAAVAAPPEAASLELRADPRLVEDLRGYLVDVVRRRGEAGP